MGLPPAWIQTSLRIRPGQDFRTQAPTNKGMGKGIKTICPFSIIMAGA
jgi:hypothetical protein